MVALVQFCLRLFSVKIIGHGDPGVVSCCVCDTTESMSHTIDPGIRTIY